MKGIYLIGYVETKEKRFLKSVHAIRNSVLRICKFIGLNVVGQKYHVFKSSNGITYCFILSQSHFVVHTWPEECKIFFDIFTCDKRLDDKKFIDAISKEFKGEVKAIKKVEYR